MIQRKNADSTCDHPIASSSPVPTEPIRLPVPRLAKVRVDSDCIRVDGLELRDRDLAHFVAQRPEQERPGLVHDALKVGLISLCHAGVSVNVDFIQKEFQRFTSEMQELNRRGAEALNAALRENFGDQDGKLPRTLETYLGNQGKMNLLVSQLADPNSRSSVIGMMKELLGKHFDGDGSKLAQLLDPTRPDGPLHALYKEIQESFVKLGERVALLETAKKVREQERQKGTAKGADFEDAVEPVLGSLAAIMGDGFERTSRTSGDAGILAGDFVITFNPSFTRGLDVRATVEAKDAKFELSKITKELADARRNRRAAVAVAVYSPGKLPEGFGPLTMHGSDIYCLFDPEDGDSMALDIAIRLARAIALTSVRQASVEVDAGALRQQLLLIQRNLQTVKGIKTKLTNIMTCAADISEELSNLRKAIEESVTAIEAELRIVEAKAS